MAWDNLTDDDKDVIRARHYGWEKASPGLLAKVFGVSVQKINAVLRLGNPYAPTTSDSGSL